MAVNLPSKPKTPEALTASQRWVRFGSNVALSILLATLLTVAVVGISSGLLRGKARSDWTAGGRFSLSPRTKALLADLPHDIRLTNLYAETPELPGSTERWSRVRDLLAEYDAASGHVEVESVNPAVDVGGVEALVARLRERYEAELEGPKALIGRFDGLKSELDTLLEAQAQRLREAAAAWPDGPEAVTTALMTVAQQWQQGRVIGEMTAAGIKSQTEQALPVYSVAVESAREYLKQMKEAFESVPAFFDQVRERMGDAAPPPPVKAVLEAGSEPYQPMIEKIDAYLKEAADVEELQIEDVRREIASGDVVLVESPDDVRVVPDAEIWPWNPQAGRDPNAPQTLFAGEQAVSSTVLGMVREEKPAVFFVTYGVPMAEQGGPYAEVADRLRKANLIVEDWDLMRGTELPEPEGMTKAVLFLVPPPPPDPQRRMPPPNPEAYHAATRLVEEGLAGAVILAEPGSMMMPQIPYAGLLETLGLNPRLEAVAVHRVVVDDMGNTRPVTRVDVTDYADHRITDPIGALPSMLWTASPLPAAEVVPAGVTLHPLLALPTGSDWWADTTGWMATQGQATFDPEADLVSTAEKPLPLAVAIERRLPAEGSGEAEVEAAPAHVQKVVCFGDADFARDDIAFYRDYFGQTAFPGNIELIVNSALWVTGTEHLITVSPEALRARRVGEMGAWEWPARLLVVVGLPLAVAVAGIVVYVRRRR